mgnify:CR=1 FL=1
MNLENARVLENKEVKPNFRKLKLYSPKVAAEAKAGQFLMIKPTVVNDPFLGRPMAIYDSDKTLGIIEILFMIKGRGTKLLAEVKVDDALPVIAPLGNGFKITETDKNVVCIAGGVGMAPIYSLIKELHNKDISNNIIVGARTKAMLLGLDKLADLGMAVDIYTDDGSFGSKGLATMGLENILKEQKIDRVYCCGSMIMMKNVAKITALYGIPCQVSLEERMGCGIGICMGCVCGHKKEDGSHGLARVCYEGPVFDAEEVIWHE